MKILFLIVSTFLYIQAFAQEKSPPPYEVMNLKFVLEGTPAGEDFGFENPKSNWHFKYELQFLANAAHLTERSTFRPFVLQEETSESSGQREKRVRKSNKQLDRAWKKLGVVVVKGNIPKTQLLNASNREIIIPIALTPEIKSILAAAIDTWDNPIFRLKVRGKVSLQTNDNLKFKGKFGFKWQCPTKFIEGTTRQLWIVNTCGGSNEIVRENNRLRFGTSSKIQ